jgi:hypothetical protein
LRNAADEQRRQRILTAIAYDDRIGTDLIGYTQKLFDGIAIDHRYVEVDELLFCNLFCGASDGGGFTPIVRLDLRQPVDVAAAELRMHCKNVTPVHVAAELLCQRTSDG